MNVLKWLGYILLLGLFVWFVFFRKLDLFSTNKNTSVAKAEQMQADNESATLDGVTDDAFVDENTESIETPSDFPAVNEPKTSQPSTDAKQTNGINLNQRYLIVVGSFGKKANADRMLKRVKNDGNEAVITTVNGMHRVVTGSTDDLSNAKSLRDHFTHIYKETAFILEN